MYMQKKTLKMPLESVKMKSLKIDLCHVLTWTKRRLRQIFHDAGTLVAEKNTQINKIYVL